MPSRTHLEETTSVREFRNAASCRSLAVEEETNAFEIEEIVGKCQILLIDCP